MAPNKFQQRAQPRVSPGLIVRRPMQAHLRTLPLAHSVPPTPARPAAWLRGAAMLGGAMPLCVAQDLGALLTQPQEQVQLGRPAALPEDIDSGAYLDFLRRLSRHPLLREVSGWDLSDAVLGVVLARLTEGVVCPEIYTLPPGTAAIDFARQLGVELDDADPAHIWRDTDPALRPELRKLLPSEALACIEGNLRRLDADELRFLHQYGPQLAGAPDPRDLLDLVNLLNLPPEVRKTVARVLQLLPQISQTAMRGGMQTYTMGGYEGLTRKGHLDNLLPSELAYPSLMFRHRILNHEALYYGRESVRERQRELVYIVTQSGLELRGDADVLARSITLALAQTMQRRGYEVFQSFIGSRCSLPSGMQRPADVLRVLYYQDEQWGRPREMLAAVAGNLRCWAERYQGMQVFWVLSEYWDADDWDLHADAYQRLRRQAGQQAWFVRGRAPKQPDRRPAAARLFHRYQTIDQQLLRQAETGAEQNSSTEEPPLKPPVTVQTGPNAGDIRTEPLSGMECVWIPSGSFMMGSPESEAERLNREGPQHDVTLDGFWLATTPVTNRQYRLWKPAHDSGTTSAGNPLNNDEQPVVRVSWEDAQAFIEWLNTQGPVSPPGRGRGWVAGAFRLPSEAEWEYACRAGTATPFFFGDTISPEQANYDGNYVYGNGPKGEYRRQTTAAAHFSPNAFGLYNMHGNVWEWCLDVYAEDAYSQHKRFNPIYDTGENRVLRGGGWRASPGGVRCACRDRSAPSFRDLDVGFRLARTFL